MWPAEKSRFSDAVLSGAVRSLQSGFLKNYREKWASVAYFSGKGVGISPQLRLAGGASTIRTFVTFFELDKSFSPKYAKDANFSR